jgi:hypothetical protein
MKTLLVGLLIAVVSCNQSIKFLGDEPLHVTCVNKKPDSVFTVTEMTPDPDYVQPGLDITLSVAGVMAKDVKITNLKIDTLQNGVQIFSENVAKSDDVAAGDDYQAIYTHGTPSSIPSGLFTNRLTLQAGSEILAIVECSFTA